ncbi:MAG: adenylosuccinate lyase [Pseudomonadota bacterium]
MTIKTLLAAAVLAVAPGLAVAMGCSGYGHIKEQTVASCPAGQVWDGDASTCVDISTS